MVAALVLDDLKDKRRKIHRIMVQSQSFLTAAEHIWRYDVAPALCLFVVRLLSLSQLTIIHNSGRSTSNNKSRHMSGEEEERRE